MAANPRLLFHVQHLLGIGHLRRAALLAQALSRRGFDVTIAQGGVPTSLFDFGPVDLVQLPPLRSADSGFSGLTTAEGQPLDEAGMSNRRDALLALYDRVEPALVMLESFPFGRRQMRFELLPLLDRIAATTPRPRVAVSIRDILQKRAPKREAETVDIVRRHVDRVLVHGDPSLIELGASFGPIAAIGDRLAYSGYVAPSPPQPTSRTQVLVSAGGGAVGASLLRKAIAARPQTRLADWPWTLIAGPNLPQADLVALQALAPDGTTVVSSVPDLPSELAASVVSVSQAGYNTVMDIAVSQTPAVLVPFAGDGETEQPMRAAQLAEQGLVTVVDEASSSPAVLARAIDEAHEGPGAWPDIACNGASVSADMMCALVNE